MILTSAFSVFVLGLRHGADPDHLAAIDNVTRNAHKRMPLLSRFAGAFFAGGHSVMVLSLAGVVGVLSSNLASRFSAIETVGAWLSISILLLMAAINLFQLRRNRIDRFEGVKTKLIPLALRKATNPLVAIPIGLLFGLGFETSSQIATYATALSANNGFTGGIVVGIAFCLGMICTDTLDGFLIHRMVSHRSDSLPRVARIWLWAVTAFAVIIATYQIAGQVGVKLPIDELTVSGILVAALLGVFVYVFIVTKRHSDHCNAKAGT